MNKRIIYLLLISVLTIVVYFVGPSPATPRYELPLPVVAPLGSLEKEIAELEAQHHLRPDNEARIVWANDSVKAATSCAIVYLHGFSASQEEGDPVHRNVAKLFNCNLYLSRLAAHGIDTSEQLLTLTVDAYWESAKRALAIGKQLGHKVILMGTSTGASQAIQLAAAYPDDVHALVLYSPNIAINDPNAWILNNPWGLQIARLVKGGNYNVPEDDRPVYKQYWSKPYRLEAAAELQEMLETSMQQETFKKVKQPVLLLYYYKDEEHQDDVVKVSAIKEMFEQLGTPVYLKQAIPVPTAGNHVIASPIKSKDIGIVQQHTVQFFESVLKLHPVEQPTAE